MPTPEDAAVHGRWQELVRAPRPAPPSDPGPPPAPGPPPGRGGVARSGHDGVGAESALPPVTHEMLAVLDGVRATADGSPLLGVLEISLDRTRVFVRWHGEVPGAVQEVVDRAVGAPFSVVVVQTRFADGELQAEVFRLMADHPGVLTGGGARTAGDGIHLWIAPELVGAGGLDAVVVQHGIRSRYPVTFEAVRALAC